MSEQETSQILSVLGELKSGQEIIHNKLRRCEAILYGREEDDKPGLGERVRRIEDVLKDISSDADELKALEKKVANLETRIAGTSKLIWLIGGAAAAAFAKLVVSLF